jgi:hypothetical protein
MNNNNHECLGSDHAVVAAFVDFGNLGIEALEFTCTILFTLVVLG